MKVVDIDHDEMLDENPDDENRAVKAMVSELSRRARQLATVSGSLQRNAMVINSNQELVMADHFLTQACEFLDMTVEHTDRLKLVESRFTSEKMDRVVQLISELREATEALVHGMELGRAHMFFLSDIMAARDHISRAAFWMKGSADHYRRAELSNN